MENTRHSSATNPSTQHPGPALRDVAARFSAWKAQRNEIAGQLRKIVLSAREMLAQLGEGPIPGGTAPVVNKGGRPRGYKTSPATKAKLRAAWARRKALAAGSSATATGSAPAPRRRSTASRSTRKATKK